MAMGGVTSDHVHSCNRYGNTDAHDEQRRRVVDEAPLQLDRPSRRRRIARRAVQPEIAEFAEDLFSPLRAPRPGR